MNVSPVLNQGMQILLIWIPILLLFVYNLVFLLLILRPDLYLLLKIALNKKSELLKSICATSIYDCSIVNGQATESSFERRTSLPSLYWSVLLFSIRIFTCEFSMKDTL